MQGMARQSLKPYWLLAQWQQAAAAASKNIAFSLLIHDARTTDNS
jgi:hypothetical protein